MGTTHDLHLVAEQPTCTPRLAATELDPKLIRQFPTLEHDMVVGMVSIGDLVTWAISDEAQTIPELEGYIIGT